MSDAYARVGHWASHILILSIGGAVLLRVSPIDPADPLALFLPLMLMVVVVASWLRMREHDRRLCERCMSSLPLSPSESAARYSRRLRTVHRASNKRLVGGYIAVLIGSAFIPGTIGLWIWAGVQATLIYLVLSSATHRRLQPWCPECSSDGGGSERISPDPVPHGSGGS
jgi:hypothetical protein